MAVDTMAEGRAGYSVDGSGNYQTTQAAVNGLNPVTVGAMAQYQKIVSASNSLGSSKTWQQAMDTAKRASLASSEGQLTVVGQNNEKVSFKFLKILPEHLKIQHHKYVPNPFNRHCRIQRAWII